ncbi:hypothetical protein [Kitasatospora sp. GP82]|uniref:hypothetical protein n=1 Tax=Kitasatospora sp. GP82 TaxID=3035089 RepID=UPI002473EC03|nr:hypothetical protein [Kitasatospora sp. GP82]MDH6129540.1 putative regulator of Ras-like GTPase activity (Roadblock/LC7/MglB family) [Kitasatospora sp. GP82]
MALLTVGAVAATVLGGARAGTDTIGHDKAPQAIRAADLYFALADMDAQAANLLLTGADPDYAALRTRTQRTYEQRRAQVDSDLQGAAEAAIGDPGGERAVHTVIDDLGQYESLVARAQLLEDQAHAPAGRPSGDALTAYRQATDLLRQQLLPAADQVTATNAAAVDHVYTAQQADLAAGRWWLLAAGLAALAALVLLQRTLAVRFRRILNPPLLAVTVLTALAVAVGLGLAAAADRHLLVAKGNAYDSVIALSRARAVAYDMNADESRYLTDPTRAAAYEQSYLDKSQSLARLGGATLADYDTRLGAAHAAHRADPQAKVPFDGFLGAELRNITFPGEQQAVDQVLASYQQYQQDDLRIRELREQGHLKDAVTFDTGTAPGQSNADFGRLSDAMDQVLAINRQSLDRAVTATDHALGSGLAVGGGILLAGALALTVLGVRPRLREYR